MKFSPLGHALSVPTITAGKIGISNPIENFTVPF